MDYFTNIFDFGHIEVTFTILKIVGVFMLAFSLDYVWAAYTFALTSGNITKASIMAGFIYLLGGLTTLGYVNDPVLLVPALLGCAAGTWFAMWMKKHDTLTPAT
jgi:hypothetical protein